MGRETLGGRETGEALLHFHHHEQGWRVVSLQLIFILHTHRGKAGLCTRVTMITATAHLPAAHTQRNDRPINYSLQEHISATAYLPSAYSQRKDRLVY